MKRYPEYQESGVEARIRWKDENMLCYYSIGG